VAFLTAVSPLLIVTDYVDSGSPADTILRFPVRGAEEPLALHCSRDLLKNLSGHFDAVFSAGFAESQAEPAALPVEPDHGYDSDSEQDQLEVARRGARPSPAPKASLWGITMAYVQLKTQVILTVD
jgi:hypothetical protein